MLPSILKSLCSKEWLKEETGASLMIALFISLILLAIITPFLAFTVTDYGISKSDVNAQKAFEVAEAGIEAARARLVQNLNFNPYLLGYGFDRTLGNADDDPNLSGSPPYTVFEGYRAGSWKPISYVGGSYQITLQNDVRPGDAETDPVADNNGIIYIISKGSVPFGNGNVAERTVEVKGNVENVWKHVISTPNTPPYTTTGNSFTITPSSGLNAPKTFNTSFFPKVSLDCYEQLAQTASGLAAPTACGNPPGTAANFNGIGGATIYLSSGAPVCAYYNTSPASDPCTYVSGNYNNGQRTLDFQSVTLQGIIYIEVSGTDPWTINVRNGTTINGVLVVANGYINFSGQADINPPLTGNGTCSTQRFPAVIALDDDATLNNPNAPDLPATPSDCDPGQPAPLVDAGNQNLHINGVIFSNGAVAANPFDVTGNIVTTGCMNLQGSTDIAYNSNVGQCPPPGFSTPSTIAKITGSWREVLK